MKTVIMKKKLKKTQIKGNIVHAYELEELKLLKCPYYPKKSKN